MHKVQAKEFLHIKDTREDNFDYLIQSSVEADPITSQDGELEPELENDDPHNHKPFEKKLQTPVNDETLEMKRLFNVVLGELAGFRFEVERMLKTKMELLRLYQEEQEQRHKQNQDQQESQNRLNNLGALLGVICTMDVLYNRFEDYLPTSKELRNKVIMARKRWEEWINHYEPNTAVADSITEPKSPNKKNLPEPKHGDQTRI